MKRRRSFLLCLLIVTPIETATAQPSPSPRPTYRVITPKPVECGTSVPGNSEGRVFSGGDAVRIAYSKEDALASLERNKAARTKLSLDEYYCNCNTCTQPASNAGCEVKTSCIPKASGGTFLWGEPECVLREPYWDCSAEYLWRNGTFSCTKCELPDPLSPKPTYGTAYPQPTYSTPYSTRSPAPQPSSF